MKLNYDRNSRDPKYFVQKGFRNGKKTTTKNVHCIGKHSDLLLITDDPLAYAKDVVRQFNEEEKKNKIVFDLVVNLAEKLVCSGGVVSSKSELSNVGYFFLQKLYHDLEISSFFKKVSEKRRFAFDPNEINRFLTYARILEPDSKLGTFDNLSAYYEKPDFDYCNIFAVMDLMAENYDEYIASLFEASEKIVKRNTSVCYYDCTNYSFEIESEDEDYRDEVTGEIVKGLRKYGISKQHQPSPLVEMGLFMDGDGIPLSMCITSGSDNEQTTALPLERKLVKMLKGKRFIYCADAGLGSLDIRRFNSMGGRSFVVTQSIKKLPDLIKQAVFEDYDYKLLSSRESVSVEMMKGFEKTDPCNLDLYNDKAYKIINADRLCDLGFYEAGVTRSGSAKAIKAKATLKQRVIVTFSRKSMEYQRFIRRRQLERAERILKTIDPKTYKKGPNDVTRFIKRIDGKDGTERYELDEEKIREEERYDGYYAIVTNLTGDLEEDLDEIFAINANRYKIEECFRILKTNFEANPVFHYKRRRIIAHFMICYTALLIYRLLERKLNDFGAKFTTDNILETLRNMQVANIEDICYKSTYTNSQVCLALNAIFGLELDRKYYLPKELNKKIRQISK